MRVVIGLTGAAIAHDLGDQRADHLRVAVVTTFTDVDITSGEFKRGVEFLQAALDVLLAIDDERGNDLHRTTDGHGHEDEHGEGQVVFDDALVPVGPTVLVGLERRPDFPAQKDGNDERGLVGVRRQEEPEDDKGDGEEDVSQRVVEDGLAPGHAVLLLALDKGDFHGLIVGSAGAGGFPDIHRTEDEAEQVKRAADRAQDVEQLDVIERLHELVFECGAALGDLVEHEALHDAGAPHRGDVEQDTYGADPEVEVGQRGGPEFPGWRAAAASLSAAPPKARGEPVEHAGSHEAVPAKRAGVDVADGPVRVMRKGVDGTDREQGAFECGHAVESDAGGEELDHRIGAQFVPGTAQGEQAVEHATP